MKSQFTETMYSDTGKQVVLPKGFEVPRIEAPNTMTAQVILELIKNQVCLSMQGRP
jgi:hypothetical protein